MSQIFFLFFLFIRSIIKITVMTSAPSVMILTLILIVNIYRKNFVFKTSVHVPGRRTAFYQIMSYFFYYQDDLPEGVGFTYFGTAHIIWLILIAAASVLAAIFMCRRSESGQKKFSLILGWCTVGIYLVRELFITCTGHMSIYELPLHLCIIAGFLCLAHDYSEGTLIGHFLYSGGIPCTVMALVSPDWTVYPAFSFISITNFAYHGLLLIYIVSQLSAGRFKISLKRTWQVFLLVCAIAVPVYVFDMIFKVNYMFLMIPSPGSVLSFISDISGDSLYLVFFALFNICVLFIMDGIYTLAKKLRRQ